MSEINNHSIDCSKTWIKPSLHKIDKIVTKRLNENGSTIGPNKQCLPFRVNHNQLMPQLLPHFSQLSSLHTQSNESIVSQNGLIKSDEDFRGKEDQNRPISCPPSQISQTYPVWPQTQCFNELNWMHKWPIGDTFHSQSSVAPNCDRNESLFESIDCRTFDNSRHLSQSKDKTFLNEVFSQTNRLYNSCPSSPKLQRFNQNINQSIDSKNRNNIVLKFHELHGSGVILSPDLTEVQRYEDSCVGSNCYAFIGQQLGIGIEITVQIIGLQESEEQIKKQSFIFGVTNANPSLLTDKDLPDNPEELIAKREQIWNLVDQFCDNCKLNDKLTLRVDSRGFVTFGMNSNPHSLLYPIQVHNLWPFFVLIGRIKAIKLISNSCDFMQIKQMTENRSKVNLFNRNSTKHLYKCLNCSTNYANTAFYKCGHKYYCYRCSQMVFQKTSKKCPLCRNTILDLIIVFP